MLRLPGRLRLSLTGSSASRRRGVDLTEWGWSALQLLRSMRMTSGATWLPVCTVLASPTATSCVAPVEAGDHRDSAGAELIAFALDLHRRPVGNSHRMYMSSRGGADARLFSRLSSGNDTATATGTHNGSIRVPGVVPASIPSRGLCAGTTPASRRERPWAEYEFPGSFPRPSRLAACARELHRHRGGTHGG